MQEHSTITKRISLEICVDEIAGVSAAIAGGADRLELCAALPLGGLTPSLPFCRAALAAAEATATEFHALVRPRAGDFSYETDELAQAIDEALMLIDAGVDGLVFGAARDGALDRRAIERWLVAVRDRRPNVFVTLHRAIDSVRDPVAAVGTAAELGFGRILSSGGAPTAAQGSETIARMVEAAGGRIAVMAGGGVGPDNVEALLLATGVSDVHASAGGAPVSVEASLKALGFATPDRRPASASVVRELRERIDTYSIGQREASSS